MAGFTPEQREVAQDFTEAPGFAHASPLVRQALFEAGIVESGLRDAPGGEGNLDSQGALQQRASQGWGTVAQERNPAKAAQMFLERAIPLAGKYGNAGALAQAVQRSAYPERYGQHAGEAGRLLQTLSGGRVSPPGAAKGVQALAGGSEGINGAQLADVQLLAGLAGGPQRRAPEVGLAPRQAYAASQTLPQGYTIPLGIQPTPAPGNADALLALVERIGQDSTSTGAHVEGSSQVVGASAGPSGKLGGFLPANATLKLGRIDQGQDGSTNPGGPILAPGNGVVVAVKSDPSGFGPSYPVVRFSSGPLAGKEVYIGHTLSALKPGQSFRGGQVLSHTGVNGYGNARGMPGWFEIGLASALGQGIHGQGAQIAPYLRGK